MKLLVLSPSFYMPEQGVRIGGGEISNLLLLEHLARRGHDICVVSIHGIDGDGDQIRGISIYNISSRRPAPFLQKFFSTVFYEREAEKIAHSFQPDIVLAITSASAIGMKLKLKMNVPGGILLRAENDLTKSSGQTGFLKSLYLKTFLGMGSSDIPLIEMSDFLIVNSFYMKEALLHKASDKEIHVVYPPVDDEQRTFNQPERINQIVSIGTSKRKGFELVKKIANNLPDIEFHVVGDPSIPAGESRRQDNLIISGWITDQSDYLETADLVLVPSEWDEPFGRIAVEALRYGRCVLVSNKGGLPEVVGHREELIVQSNEPADWVDRINEMNQNMSAYTDICRSVSKHTSRFVLEEQAANMEEILESKLLHKSLI